MTVFRVLLLPAIVYRVSPAAREVFRVLNFHSNTTIHGRRTELNIILYTDDNRRINKSLSCAHSDTVVGRSDIMETTLWSVVPRS